LTIIATQKFIYFRKLGTKKQNVSRVYGVKFISKIVEI